MRDPEHVSLPVARAMSKVRNGYKRRSHLAPLEPNAFMRWAWERGPKDKGTSPLTIEDWWFEVGSGVATPGYTFEMLRKDFIRTAARVRRNQRLGRDPFEGVR